jgi:hypothetical protein
MVGNRFEQQLTDRRQAHEKIPVASPAGRESTLNEADGMR